MIDLPDGQKIVVGKMTQGSVIEVATWRGVGRPDSRTSRLMLGMGSGNVNEENSDQASASQGSASAPAKPSKPAGIAGLVFSATHFIKNFSRINWSATFKALIKSLASKSSKKVEKSTSRPERPTSLADMPVAPAITVSPVSEDAEIEAWLNSITEKAARTSTSASKPSVKKAPQKKAPQKKAAPAKKAAPKTTNKRK